MIASDGYTYEREAMESLLQEEQAVSPKTRELLEKKVVGNHTLAHVGVQAESQRVVWEKMIEMMENLVEQAERV